MRQILIAILSTLLASNAFAGGPGLLFTSGCIPLGIEVCTGGLDEDCDGMIDGADSDCGAATCTQRFADNFTRGDGVLGNGWTVVDGAISISSNAASGVGIASQATQLNSATHQWSRIKFGTTADASTFLRLNTSDGSVGYIFNITATNLLWDWIDWTEMGSVALPIAPGDNAGVMTSYTGASTVISVWKNTANSSPYSAGSVCTNTALPCWDDAADTPDGQITADPTSASDTALGFGFSISSGGGTVDDFSAGDCAN